MVLIMLNRVLVNIVNALLLLFLLSFVNKGLALQVDDKNNVIPLEKVGEIKEGFSSFQDSFFIKITGMCTDFDDNLYVIDSGWNKIFKFDSKGTFIKSFGRAGQGPGEFLGNPEVCHLSLSFGNDGKIYILDTCNRKLSIFSTGGIYEKQFPIYGDLVDSAAVNSNGDIYLLSQGGIKLIERYNSDFILRRYLLNFEFHYQFPHVKPIEWGNRISPPMGLLGANMYEIIKSIDKFDNLIVFSNFSLKAVVFDKNNERRAEFSVEEHEIIDDIKKQLMMIQESYNNKFKKSTEKRYTTAFVLPFGAFLDNEDNLCLVYENIGGVSIIYRYKLDGSLLGKNWKFPERIKTRYLTSNSAGWIFTVDQYSRKILTFKHKSLGS